MSWSEVGATAPDVPMSPEGTQEIKNTCHPAGIRLRPFLTMSPEEIQDVKTGH